MVRKLIISALVIFLLQPCNLVDEVGVSSGHLAPHNNSPSLLCKPFASNSTISFAIHIVRRIRAIVGQTLSIRPTSSFTSSGVPLRPTMRQVRQMYFLDLRKALGSGHLQRCYQCSTRGIVLIMAHPSQQT